MLVYIIIVISDEGNLYFQILQFFPKSNVISRKDYVGMVWRIQARAIGRNLSRRMFIAAPRNTRSTYPIRVSVLNDTTERWSLNCSIFSLRMTISCRDDIGRPQ